MVTMGSLPSKRLKLEEKDLSFVLVAHQARDIFKKGIEAHFYPKFPDS